VCVCVCVCVNVANVIFNDKKDFNQIRKKKEKISGVEKIKANIYIYIKSQSTLNSLML
jgi:hypothetical protein